MKLKIIIEKIHKQKLLDSDSEEFWEEFVTEELATNPNY